MITVRREDADLEGISPKDVAQHIARFTGLWDVHIDSRVVQGQLYAPARLPMAISVRLKKFQKKKKKKNNLSEQKQRS